jgi:hypothetical protein
MAERDEDGWYLMPDGKKTSCVCPWCDAPYIPMRKTQKRCGSAACKLAALKADPVRWERRKEQFRAGSRRYVEAHRDERNARRRCLGEAAPTPPSAPAPAPDPWQAPCPEAGTHLPGAWRELVLTPAPRTPIPHTHVTSIHGIVSAAVGQDHSRRRADFVLTQASVPSGWGAYFVDGAVARRLSCAPMPGLNLEGRPWGICFGPGVVTPKRPAPVTPGRTTVEVTTLSPVVIRRSSDGKTLVRVVPTGASILRSLTGLEFLRRCGLADTESPPWTREATLILLDHDTRREAVEVNGHWNAGDGSGHDRIAGWTGTVRLAVNAVTLWLLRHAEIVGLGGRVAAAFGQVRVRVIEDDPSRG